MSDIVKRLRSRGASNIEYEAADEIERLRAEVGLLRVSLREANNSETRLRAALKRLIADYEDVPDPTDADGQAVFADARAAVADQGKG